MKKWRNTNGWYICPKCKAKATNEIMQAYSNGIFMRCNKCNGMFLVEEIKDIEEELNNGELLN